MYRSVNVAYPYLFGLVVVVWLGAPARAELAFESYPDQRALDAEHLMVTPDWIGFVWPRSARPSVRTLIQQLAQRRPTDAVIVVGIVQQDGRRTREVDVVRLLSAPLVPIPDDDGIFWMVQSDRATPALDLRLVRGGAIAFIKGSF